MAVYLLDNIIPQFENQNGVPLVGARLYFYAAGTTTKLDTYTDSTGTIPNSNPMILNASGYPTTAGTIGPAWLQGGLLYKVGLAASTEPDPPGNFIWTLDNVKGIGDTTTAISEWIASGFTPTFISASSFSVPGDQTSTLTESRRLQITDAGGTKYATITSTVFGAVTTVTVAVDNGGVLSSPVAAVSYGIVNPVNPSIDTDMVERKGNAVVSAATTDIWSGGGSEIHVTGSTGPITSFGTAPYAGNRRTIIWDSTPAVTHNATTLQIPGGQSVTVAAGDRWEVLADTTANMIVVSIVRATGIQTLTLPRDYISGFTLTTASTTTYDIAAGQATDSTNAAPINGAALAAKSQAAWAIGSSAGGKLSAAAMANNTWYYWFALLKDSDGTVDYGFDVSTTPTMPSGYTKFRYLGGRKTASGATTWDTFIQHGDFVQWSTPPAADVSGALTTANRTLTTMNVPAVRIEWFGEILVASPGATGEGIIATDPLCADVAPSPTASPLGSVTWSVSAAGVSRVSAQCRCWTNTSSQIGLRAVTAQAAIVQTFGWTDPRGKPV